MIAEKNIRETILNIVERIVRDYQPEKVILFGSFAYGAPGEDSDVDLLIVKDTDKSPLERWMEVKKILRGTARELPVSPLVYTKNEIEERKGMKDFFIEEIFEKGIELAKKHKIPAGAMP